MPFTVMFYAYRKPGTSTAHFKDYYENHHIPLIQSLVGPTFPRSHVRRYIQRSETIEDSEGSAEGSNNVCSPANVVVGCQTDFEYDVIGELSFENEDAWKAFYAKISEKEVAEKIAEDEERFLEKMKAVVLSDCVVTNRKDESHMPNPESNDG
ncbi:MAG: hypothetical protein Q9226_008641 [Calogaya cf. arnoldii]